MESQTSVAVEVAKVFGPAEAAPKALNTGKTLTGTGLLSLIDQAQTEVDKAGAKRINTLVSAFVNLPFTSGVAVFRDAREKATEKYGKKNPLLVRLSEAHSIYTAIAMGGEGFETFAGQGWAPAVAAARKILKDKNLTNAGNTRTTPEERDAKAKARLDKEVNAAVAGIMTDTMTAEDIVAARASIRETMVTAAAEKAVPTALIGLAKTLDACAGHFATIMQGGDKLPDGISELARVWINTAPAAIENLCSVAAVLIAERDAAQQQKAKAKKAA